MSHEFIKFPSRRSTVYSTKGMVALSQPQANAAGIKILELGGNSVDAAIAVLAALCVTEPMSTGIGGDCFAIYYKNGDILGLNGTGRAAKELTIEEVVSTLGSKRIPLDSVFSITTPGAIAGWYDAYTEWGSGKVLFEQILQPAIDLAENGYVVHEITANMWLSCKDKLIKQNQANSHNNPFLVNGDVPKEGDVVTNHQVAKTLRLIGKHGKEVFYNGEIATAIIDTVKPRGHKLLEEDLNHHTSTFVDPISLSFQGKKVWEIPPNGHGLVAQLALGVIQLLHNLGKIDLYSLHHNSPQYLHLLIELCKMAFHDSDEYVSDPTFHQIPIEQLLDTPYLDKRAQELNLTSLARYNHGIPDPKYKSDTVYLTVADNEGNACSFINSVFEGFGTGIVVGDYGFCLHNRGSNFNLTPGAPNSLQGGKRPYHTIIPGLITNDDGSLYALFGNMGAFAQPVCHVQHVLNMVVFGMTPQQLIDLPRFVLDSDYDANTDRGRGSHGPIHTSGTVVVLEDGIPQETSTALQAMGHTTVNIKGYDRGFCGRAQIIKKQQRGNTFVYAGGLDPRGDGAVVAQI